MILGNDKIKLTLTNNMRSSMPDSEPNHTAQNSKRRRMKFVPWITTSYHEKLVG